MQAVHPRADRHPTGWPRALVSTDAPAHYDYCRAWVDALLDANADIAVVERTIDAYRLDSNAKAALWL
jgi:hypothetical protein